MNNNKLFVYGIFLDEFTRRAYGMSNPAYAIVKDYSTRVKSGDIVEAVKAPGHALTGLVVDVDPRYWKVIDRLEYGYTRKQVKTSAGNAWMYAAPDQTERS